MGIDNDEIMILYDTFDCKKSLSLCFEKATNVEDLDDETLNQVKMHMSVQPKVQVCRYSKKEAKWKTRWKEALIFG